MGAVSTNSSVHEAQGEFQLRLGRRLVGIAFRGLYGHANARVREQVPGTPAAGAGEQPALPPAGLTPQMA